MKSDLDFHVSQRCVVFKLLLGFYSSVLADDDSKVGDTLLIPLCDPFKLTGN
jgi:hypothetical protein